MTILNSLSTIGWPLISLRIASLNSNTVIFHSSIYFRLWLAAFFPVTILNRRRRSQGMSQGMSQCQSPCRQLQSQYPAKMSMRLMELVDMGSRVQLRTPTLRLLVLSGGATGLLLSTQLLSQETQVRTLTSLCLGSENRKTPICCSHVRYLTDLNSLLLLELGCRCNIKDPISACLSN